MKEPTEGARWREGLLLAAYLALAVIGVWTVVVAELATQDLPRPERSSVTLATQKSSQGGK